MQTRRVKLKLRLLILKSGWYDGILHYNPDCSWKVREVIILCFKISFHKRQSEYETIAQNVMVILKRTGDEFRPLTFEEYKEERMKDENFSEKERAYFDEVIKFCVSAETAILFSKAWEL